VSKNDKNRVNDTVFYFVKLLDELAKIDEK